MQKVAAAEAAKRKKDEMSRLFKKACEKQKTPKVPLPVSFLGSGSLNQDANRSFYPFSFLDGKVGYKPN